MNTTIHQSLPVYHWFSVALITSNTQVQCSTFNTHQGGTRDICPCVFPKERGRPSSHHVIAIVRHLCIRMRQRQIFRSMITHQGRKRNISPCTFLKRTRTSLKPFWVVEIDWQPFQWHTLAIDRFGDRNAIKRAVPPGGAKG